MASIPYSERKFDKKKKQEYDAEYKKNNYDSLHLLFPKGYKDKIRTRAAENGMSACEYIRTLIDNDMN